MKTKKLFCFLFLCCLIISSTASAKSPVWKISKNGHHLYLGGTIHLLAKSDYPLPKAFDTAYQNSAVLVLETDLEKFNTPEVQKKIITISRYPAGEDIRRFLKPKTTRALKKYLASRGLPFEHLVQLKPGMLSLTLTMIELQRLHLGGTGVDEFYSLRALNDTKEIKHLESVNEQLQFIATMGQGNENAFIEHTLEELKDLPKLFGSMKKAWRNGNNALLEKVGIATWQDEFPNLYHSLLVRRNNNWIPQIESMLETKEVELILFGALHLAGEKGILAQLKARGYTIENQ